MDRKQFIQHLGITSSALMLFGTGLFGRSYPKSSAFESVRIRTPKVGEDILSFIHTNRLFAEESGDCKNLWSMFNLPSLTDIMLHNNPIDRTASLTQTNDAVIKTRKGSGTNVVTEAFNISSIYQTEPSRIQKR